MSGPNAPYTQLDANQVLQQAFDESQDKLRVDASVSIGDINVDVALDAAAGDNVAISDGTDTLLINPDGSINVVATTSANESTLIDEVSSSVTYFGYASPGTAQSAASWKIKKLSVSGTVTSILFADGNANYDNIWNNRASLTYT